MLEALEALSVGGNETIKVIEPFTDHGRPVIRTAFYRALLQLSNDRQWANELIRLLENPQLQARRAALMDLGAVGWRPPMEPIRRTLAENNLK